MVDLLPLPPRPCRIPGCPLATVPGLRLCRRHWPLRGESPAPVITFTPVAKPQLTFDLIEEAA